MNILKKILDNNAISENIVVTEISGLVRSFEGNIIETDAFPATVGSICEIHCITMKILVLKLSVLEIIEIC